MSSQHIIETQTDGTGEPQKGIIVPLNLPELEILSQSLQADGSIEVHVRAIKEKAVFWICSPKAMRQVPPGQRGRVKHHPARNLLDRLRKHWHTVWVFLEDLRVAFDNNQAERDLRIAKVQQKIVGTFRSATGATAFCAIRSYLSTMQKQGHPLLAALTAVFHGHPFPVAWTPE